MKTTKKELEHHDENKTLYALSGDYAQLQYKLDEFTDETSEDAEREEVYAALDAIDERIEAKVSNIVKLMKFIEQRAGRIKGEQEFVSSEAERLKKRFQRFERRVEGLRDYLVLNFDRLGIRKMETDIATVSVGEPAERIEVDENRVFEWPNDIFEACVEETVKVNRSTLKQMFADQLGKLPGVVLVPGKRRVTIK